MKASIDFYTRILDFKHVGTWPEGEFPSFSILTRGGAELHLSNYPGDGVFGSVVAIIVNDIDALFKTYKDRGLDTSGKKQSPVHQGPLDQTWGTREFYADDPDGNVLRFIMRR